MNNLSFIKNIDKKIDDLHLLKHPFYEAWNAGELKTETIQEYAAQYFNHVQAFPRYLSSIHTNCDNIKIRQIILENLVDEEMGDENHPELWMRFAEGTGINREEVISKKMIVETKNLVDTFSKLSKNEKTHIGIAALYCYESMVPEIAETKIEGLKKYYNITDKNTLKFFTVHMHADKWHREVIRNLIVELGNNEQNRQEILKSVDNALESLNGFLSGIQRVYC
tara:strand:- start:49 stop:720 length:672 start_codon:yes stop_codon:yes gene_type:complete